MQFSCNRTPKIPIQEMQYGECIKLAIPIQRCNGFSYGRDGLCYLQMIWRAVVNIKRSFGIIEQNGHGINREKTEEIICTEGTEREEGKV